MEEWKDGRMEESDLALLRHSIAPIFCSWWSIGGMVLE
jgi:hypothetical protein